MICGDDQHRMYIAGFVERCDPMRRVARTSIAQFGFTLRHAVAKRLRKSGEIGCLEIQCCQPVKGQGQIDPNRRNQLLGSVDPLSSERRKLIVELKYIGAARGGNLLADLLDPGATGGGAGEFQEQVRLEILVEAADDFALNLI